MWRFNFEAYKLYGDLQSGAYCLLSILSPTMALEIIHRTVYPWGAGPIGNSSKQFITDREVDDYWHSAGERR